MLPQDRRARQPSIPPRSALQPSSDNPFHSNSAAAAAARGRRMLAGCYRRPIRHASAYPPPSSTGQVASCRFGYMRTLSFRRVGGVSNLGGAAGRSLRLFPLVRPATIPPDEECTPFSLLVLTDLFSPQVGMATVEVLEHFGCKVDFPAGHVDLCGQPRFNAMGIRTKLRPLAARMIRLSSRRANSSSRLRVPYAVR